MLPVSFLIVGAGHLGANVGTLLVSSGSSVTAETLTTTSHPQLRKIGMTPRLRSTSGSFDSILFAVPPSGSSFDYHSEIERALRLWNSKGPFVFISSTAVFSEEDGGVVTENSPLSHSLRASTLIQGEKLVLDRNGTILRLAGLYDETSGPHCYYESQAQSALRGDGLINLIHYQDAAEIAFTLLKIKRPKEIFLGSDNSPITRIDLVSLWAKHRKQSSFCQFIGAGPLGKRVDSSSSLKILNLNPRYSSFADFISRLS